MSVEPWPAFIWQPLGPALDPAYLMAPADVPVAPDPTGPDSSDFVIYLTSTAPEPAKDGLVRRVGATSD
jgi:hypothetical protein